MKKLFSYVSLFLCAFMLCGNVLIVNAAEEYDVYKSGETITKEMSNGKKVSFTVIEDEGKNSKYVKVIANPTGLSQYNVTTTYSYNDIILEGWLEKVINLSDELIKVWGQSGTVRVTEGGNELGLLTKSVYDEFVDKYATENYGNAFSSLSEENKTKVTTDIEKILAGQTFWVINSTSAEDGTTTYAYDRIENGKYVNAEMDDTKKTDAMNVTVYATICKTPKQKPSNPNTADNNVLILSIIGAGCIICIITIGRKILA